MTFKLKTLPKKFKVWIDSPEKQGWHYFDFEKPLNFCPNYDEGGNYRGVYQFIGLQDKNGKDVFEGDILSFDRKRKPERVTSDETFSKYEDYGYMIVSFDDGGFADVCLERDENNDLVAVSFDELAMCDLKKWVIVGNVVENPEMLEQKVLWYENIP